ncbi:MAG TPA: tetraacyldisaccharide 4'-kinase [Verrucomicrobiae bacterium]|nr:tetraacyldisaccharide 4'-kinase [Verrucomicrobiae bacterium]
MSLRGSILWPFSLPYGGVAHLRARAYRKGILKQRWLDGIVISVGNLTVGGTGKTPMVLWLAENLAAEGKKVGILTRGYRGEPSPEGDPGKSTSDEVRLLQSRLGDRVAFGVGGDRFAKGQELEKQGIEWMILDDGFQHLQLARDADVVLLDASDPFGGGHLLPAGRLRESRTSLSRADIIVITRSSHSPAVEAAVRRDSQAPIFYARMELEAALPVPGPANEAGANSDASSVKADASGTRNAGDERTRKWYAFCGIGNPGAFFSDLREWGFEISGHKIFPDHHRYTRADVDAIAAAAEASGAEGVICTEKDVFNLSGLSWRLPHPVFCRIRVCLDREEEFWRALLSAIESRRKQRAGHLPLSSRV